MNITRFARSLTAVVACIASVNAGASHIDISPSLTATTVGSLFSVVISVSGLNGQTPALALSDFDLDVSYNPALLRPSLVTFGTGLGNPPDASGFDFASPGIVDLFAVSFFADYAMLRGMQGDSFTLATLTFLALATGTDSLALVQNPAFIVAFINADNQNPVNAADPSRCQSLSCIGIGPAAQVAIRQGVGVLPEPGPALLLVAAALALAARRRTASVVGPKARLKPEARLT